MRGFTSIVVNLLRTTRTGGLETAVYSVAEGGELIDGDGERCIIPEGARLMVVDAPTSWIVECDEMLDLHELGLHCSHAACCGFAETHTTDDVRVETPRPAVRYWGFLPF